jgi:hypothetical protein
MRGATNLKARSIAEKAGIAVGSIYNLFGDLDQVHGFVNMRLLDGLAQAGGTAVRISRNGRFGHQVEAIGALEGLSGLCAGACGELGGHVGVQPTTDGPEHISTYEGGSTRCSTSLQECWKRTPILVWTINAAASRPECFGRACMAL